jgi:hypothetical protein
MRDAGVPSAMSAMLAARSPRPTEGSAPSGHALLGAIVDRIEP